MGKNPGEIPARQIRPSLGGRVIITRGKDGLNAGKARLREESPSSSAQEQAEGYERPGAILLETGEAARKQGCREK